MGEHRAGSKGHRLLRLLAWSLVWVFLTNVAAEILGVYCWQPYTHPVETARLTAAWTEFRDCQVLVVGSSLVEFGFSPPVIEEEVERELGLQTCVLNLGQRGLSSESAVSYLRAVLGRTQPEIVIWGTSPQECMTRNRGHYLQTYASPSDVVRASWALPASWRDATRAAAAYFRPPALILQGGLLAGSLLAGRFLSLAPTRFQREMARTRKYSGWFPGHPGARGSKARWESTIHWRSIREMTELTDRYHLGLAVLLMPINEEVVEREAVIRQKFSAVLGDYCRQAGIPYGDLLQPPFTELERNEYMRDGRHLAAEGARKLSREVARRIVIPLLKELEGPKGNPRKEGLDNGRP